MKIQFRTLVLNCRKSREVIEFSPQISFFHGQIGAGKSSIARLIDFCLGGDLERTPAITKELVSVELSAHIGDYEVIFEREAHGSNQVQVTWRNDVGESASVLAPLHVVQNPPPLWGEDVYNLSDLLFYLSGFGPLKVRKSKLKPDSPMVRLSFRDLLWYCYLEQDFIDSSFYKLEDAMRRLKSRDVMRFVFGYYSEKMSELETKLEQARQERNSKIEAAKRLRSFLQEFGYHSEQEMASEMQKVEQDLKVARDRLRGKQGERTAETHFADQLRQRLRDLSEKLGQEEKVLVDVRSRIAEQESLRAELLSTKFRMARAQLATAVLSGAKFDLCPACGNPVHERGGTSPQQCYLCGRPSTSAHAKEQPDPEIFRRDLSARITEIEESINRHKNAIGSQERLVADLRKQKTELDGRLTEELRNYDSAFIAKTRDLERTIATLEEKLRGMERVRKLPESVTKLESEADSLLGLEEGLRREIEREHGALTNADRFVSEVEDAFLEALLAVRVPGVQQSDQVKIERKTWIPLVLPEGEEALRWTFYNAGSAGKKTLFNACYALAVHRVAAQRKLPLPTFLIIDTPMKNIGEDVNRDIFVSFYTYLYKLASGPLSNTQFILVDKEFIAPKESALKHKDRFMTPTDGDHPPLIPYYRGP